MKQNNTQKEKRYTCESITCPCMKQARKKGQVAGKGRHERYWFTKKDEEEVQWDSTNYPKCKHTPLPEIVEGPDRKKVLKVLAVIAAVIVAIIVACNWDDEEGGTSRPDDKKTGTQQGPTNVETAAGMINSIFGANDDSEKKAPQPANKSAQ